MKNICVITFFFLLLVKIVCLLQLPITLDEAYYSFWAKNLNWGYLDHPPMVALLGNPTRMFGNTELSARFVPMCFMILTGIYLYKTCRALNVSSLASVFAVMIFTGSVSGLGLGLLLNPDSALALFWVSASYYGVRALTTNRSLDWLLLGLMCGLGFLSKYTMVLFVGSFFIFLFTCARQRLVTSKPWIAILVFLFAVSPNFVWNASNEWIGYKFQLKRGFTGEHDVSAKIEEQSGLPIAQPSHSPGTREYLFTQKFWEAEPPVAHFEKPPLQRLIRRQGEFASSVLGVWGILLFPLFVFFANRPRKNHLLQTLYAASEPLKMLLYTGFLPLAFFWLVSFGSKIEANWIATYLVAAVIITASTLGRINTKDVKFFVILSSIAALSNYIFALAALNSQHTGLNTKYLTRINKETAGNAQLAQSAIQLTNGAPIFFDSYQTGSILNWHTNEGAYLQWPGITRISEYSRMLFETRPNQQLIQSISPGFYLVSTNGDPPLILPYRIERAFVLSYCGQDPVKSKSIDLESFDKSIYQCENNNLVKRWFVYFYRGE